MDHARFRHDRHQIPSSVRMLTHGLEAAQELTTTLRDLRRTVKLLQSGLVILFPDETPGLQLLYSTLDRDLMQVERTSQFITHQLLIAMQRHIMTSYDWQLSVARQIEESGSTGFS